MQESIFYILNRHLICHMMKINFHYLTNTFWTCVNIFVYQPATLLKFYIKHKKKIQFSQIIVSTHPYSRDEGKENNNSFHFFSIIRNQKADWKFEYKLWENTHKNPYLYLKEIDIVQGALQITHPIISSVYIFVQIESLSTQTQYILYSLINYYNFVKVNSSIKINM